MLGLVIFLLVVCPEDLVVGSAFKGRPAPTVTTPNGRLKGKFLETRGGRTIEAFLGIPFAKPPLGSLRFEPPQPADPWSHELLAVIQPLSCIQILDPFSSEDCLYLNVFTPKSRSKPLLPVIVFLYGGAFEVGAAYGYTPEYLLDRDVLLVVIQYRLGLLGFLSTGDEVVPGNMGLKDQRLGLRWVRDNIACFGGDPDKVTIAGQSAGAVSVHYQMIFAADEGLFRAGISLSGTALFPWSFRPPKEIKMMIQVLAELSGCPTDSVGFVECLRARPDVDLIRLYDTNYKNVVYGGVNVITSQFLPLLGGVIEPECVEDRFVTGNPWDYNITTPWIVGVASKEVLFVFIAELTDKSDSGFLLINVGFDTYFPLAVNYQSSNADGFSVPFNIREFYLEFQPITRLTLAPFINACSDAFFTYSTHESLMRSNKEKSYLYYIDYLGANQIFPIPPDGRIGASHAEELFFFFPNPGTYFPDRQFDSPQDDILSEILITLVVNFATCLDPTPQKTCELQWDPFFPNQSFLNIKQFNISMDAPFLPERMDFWKSQPFPFRDDKIPTPPCTQCNTTRREEESPEDCPS